MESFQGGIDYSLFLWSVMNVQKAKRMDRHRMGEMPVGQVIRLPWGDRETPVLVDGVIRQLATVFLPAGGILNQSERVGHLCRRREGELGQRQVIVGDHREERVYPVVVDLRAGAVFKSPRAVRLDFRLLLQEQGDIPQERICPLLKELIVSGILPMEIEMLAEPSGSGGGESVLNPSGHGITLKSAVSRHRQSVFPEEDPCELLVLTHLVPKRVQIAQALIKMVADISWPITQLGVEVVVVIALPWRQETIVRCPDRLQ